MLCTSRVIRLSVNIGICLSASLPVFAVEPAFTRPMATLGFSPLPGSDADAFDSGLPCVAMALPGFDATRTARSPARKLAPAAIFTIDTVSCTSLASTTPISDFRRAITTPESSLISCPSLRIVNLSPTFTPSLIPREITRGSRLTIFAGNTISRILLAASRATWFMNSKSS